MKVWVTAGLAIAVTGVADAQKSDSTAVCNALIDAKVVADDGTFLGTVSSKYDSDSIFNKYGKGSKYDSNSIWNKYGTYGSDYSDQSVASKYTANPPMLIKDRQIVGYLTRNKSISGAVDPVVLGVVCFDIVID